jgi:hypothetical protein
VFVKFDKFFVMTHSNKLSHLYELSIDTYFNIILQHLVAHHLINECHWHPISHATLSVKL